MHKIKNDNDDDNVFGDRLRILLDESDMEGKELANILHVKPPTISNWLNGNRFPSDRKVILKIASLFNVTVGYLLGATDDRCEELEVRYTKAFDFMDKFVEILKEKGYDLSDKSSEEIAEIVATGLKLLDITKGN